MSDRPAPQGAGATPDPAGALVLIYTTLPSPEAAEELGAALIETGLIACINIIPGMVSLYRWQGKLERAAEVVAILKTTRDRLSATLERTEALHPYDTPALIVIDPASVNPSYLAWAGG